MKKIEKNNKILIVDINSIIYFIVFIIFLSIVIFFISLGLRNTDISMQLTKVYNQDQANAINALADSAIGKVNNTIAITAIFFTVIVASISVFQILKFRDFEKMKQSVLVETTEFNKNMEELNKELIQLKINKDELYEHNVELEISLTVFKIYEWFKNPPFQISEFANMIDRVILLSKKYPHLIKDEDLANMYYLKVITSNDEDLYTRQQNILWIKKAISLIKNRSILITRKFTRILIDLCESVEEKKVQLQEINDLVDNDINDVIWLILVNYNRFKDMDNKKKDEFIDKAMEDLKELKYCYGDYAIDKIRTEYNEGAFNKLNENTKFHTKFLNLIYGAKECK